MDAQTDDDKSKTKEFHESSSFTWIKTKQFLLIAQKMLQRQSPWHLAFHTAIWEEEKLRSLKLVAISMVKFSCQKVSRNNYTFRVPPETRKALIDKMKNHGKNEMNIIPCGVGIHPFCQRQNEPRARWTKNWKLEQLEGRKHGR